MEGLLEQYSICPLCRTILNRNISTHKPKLNDNNEPVMDECIICTEIRSLYIVEPCKHLLCITCIEHIIYNPYIYDYNEDEDNIEQNELIDSQYHWININLYGEIFEFVNTYVQLRTDLESYASDIATLFEVIYNDSSLDDSNENINIEYKLYQGGSIWNVPDTPNEYLPEWFTSPLFLSRNRWRLIRTQNNSRYGQEFSYCGKIVQWKRRRRYPNNIAILIENPTVLGGYNCWEIDYIKPWVPHGYNTKWIETYDNNKRWILYK